MDEANYPPVIKSLIAMKQDIMNNTNYLLESIAEKKITPGNQANEGQTPFTASSVKLEEMDPRNVTREQLEKMNKSAIINLFEKLK